MIYEILGLLFAVIAVYGMYRILKAFTWIIVNSIVAFLALLLLNMLGFAIEINIWSVLIVAIGGFAGLAMVVLLKLLGLAF